MSSGQSEIVPAESTSNDTKPINGTTAGATAVELEPPPNGEVGNIEIQTEFDALCCLIHADLTYINVASENFSFYADPIREVSEKFNKLKQDPDSAGDLRELKKIIKKLKLRIASRHNGAEDFEARRVMMTNLAAKIKGASAVKVFDKMPDLYKNPELVESLDFKEFESIYLELEPPLKLCLLSFSVFPENVEIKKRMMLYWWIADGFAKSSNSNTPKESAKELFAALLSKGFIEPVYRKQSPRVDICKMHPFVRIMVIKLAEKANFFDFDVNGDAKEDYSGSLTACLTGKGLTNIHDLHKLHALFNVSESILELEPEWLSKMKNINILYLGRWQTSPTHHIEVEEVGSAKAKKKSNVLDGLGSMRYLRFLSLQGVSQITELPETISKLSNLEMLDLRACHSLELLPKGIGSLSSLTHLDISECYLLNQMPKGLALLTKLQVLNGFVVGESQGKNTCNLEDLWKLTALRKLSIHTALKGFPSEKDLCALNRFVSLEKLTIAWGRAAINAATDKTRNSGRDSASTSAQDVQNQEDGQNETTSAALPQTRPSSSNDEINARNQANAASEVSVLQQAQIRISTTTMPDEFPIPELPSSLTKLDLQSFPVMMTPKWMRPGKLKNLKKLYIRGGKFCDLGQIQEIDCEEEGEERKERWEVEVLRLKYLTEIEMDWRELQALFPNLSYLEKVKCPNLSLFPCDETGVWIKKEGA